jgi:hypothetical protein
VYRVFEKSFNILKAYINLFRRHVKSLNCHNVAKHTEFCLGYLRLNETSTGIAGCFKKELYNYIPNVTVRRGYSRVIDVI